MPWRTLVPLAVVWAALGMLFGAAEVTTVAFADEQGQPGVRRGAARALGARQPGGRAPHRRRHLAARPGRAGPVGRVGMACAMAPLYFVDSIPVMGLVLLLGGFAIAPTLIATLSLTERTVPPARLTEGMAILHTGMVAGVAPGAALAGVVVDAHGASAAYLVCVAAGVVAALAAQALPRSRLGSPP